jgi:hypothetical protein
MSDIALLHEYLDGKSNYRRTRDFLNRTTADGMIWAFVQTNLIEYLISTNRLNIEARNDVIGWIIIITV